MTDPQDLAFSTLEIRDGVVRHGGGMTKREYFAALAMEGMIAGSQGLKISAMQFAAQSVKLADALIGELNLINRVPNTEG